VKPEPRKVNVARADNLDRSFVEHWSRRYEVNPIERELLTKVGPAVARRGHYRMDGLLKVGKWKAARIVPLLARNSSVEVEEITREALADPEYLRHWTLQRLRGVGAPMASALLTVWAPDRYTVLDFRAARSLHRMGELPGPDETPDFPTYLECCRAISKRLGVGLRDLDRALWQWSKEGMPNSVVIG
jgi:hypothetical protein